MLACTRGECASPSQPLPDERMSTSLPLSLSLSASHTQLDANLSHPTQKKTSLMARTRMDDDNRLGTIDRRNTQTKTTKKKQNKTPERICLDVLIGACGALTGLRLYAYPIGRTDYLWLGCPGVLLCPSGTCWYLWSIPRCRCCCC